MSQVFKIAPIVEGHGEIGAVPVLLRRLVSAIDETLPVDVARPLRVPRSRLVRAGVLEHYVELAARYVGNGNGGVLVVLDADDDCARSLAGRRGLSSALEPPPVPEAIRDAKGWLQSQRVDGLAYSPTVDQPALADAFDLAAARGAVPSFDKLWRDVERLLRHADRGAMEDS